MKLKGEDIVDRFLFQIFFTVLLTNVPTCSRAHSIMSNCVRGHIIFVYRKGSARSVIINQ